MLLTSLFFGLWHTPLVFFAPPFRLPWPASAIYVVGAMLGGVVFGLLRQLSGSIVPVAFCHALWNGFGYALFGAGKERGALGLEPFSIFHAETGAVALAVNAVFAALLYSYVFGSYVFGEPQGDAAPPRVDRETEPRNTPS